MMVGSIELTIKEGDTLRRGDEVGYFAFGGCEWLSMQRVRRPADSAVCFSYHPARLVSRLRTPPAMHVLTPHLSEKGSVTFDEDILESSRAACESLVKVGHGIGRAAASDAAAA
jgi:phosphatidylserine decarboxylase